MIPHEIHKQIRPIELRTNHLMTAFAAGAQASARFTHCTPAASKANPALNSIRPLKRRERRTPVSRNSKRLEFEGFGNCGEFAIIRNRAGEASLVLIPSNSMELETQATKP